MSDEVQSGRVFVNRSDRVLRLFEGVAILVAAGMLLTTMVLISTDAVLRYVLNKPLVFQLAVTEDYLMVGLVLMSLAWGFRTGGYIRINAIAAVLPHGAREVLLRAGLFVSTCYVAVLCWKSWAAFHDAFVSGAIKFGVVDFPVWLSHIWIPFGLGLLAVRLFLTAVGPVGCLDTHHDNADEL